MSGDEGAQRGLNILCMDGGGVRGLSSLLMVEELMKRIQKLEGLNRMPEPGEYFDVIAGTGTGAVQACMLGRLHIPLQSAIKIYVQLVKDVFSEKKRIGSGAFKATKLKEAIKKIVRDATGDEDETIVGKQPEDDECKIMIFAMSTRNMNAGIPTMFRSYPAFANEGLNCTIWEALCATMAHPDLFKSFQINGPLSTGKYSFVDAGMGCNNPLAHVLTEVKATFPDRHVASIVSVGTGHTRTIQISDSSSLRRFLPTNVMVAMKNIATDSERVAQDMLARFGKLNSVYFRLNVDQGMQDVGLSQWERLNDIRIHTQAYMGRVEVNLKMERGALAVKEKKPMIPTSQIDGQIPGLAEDVAIKRCPAPTPVFTGRIEEIKQVETCILGSERERRVCVLHGLGGIGKTQLALKAVENTYDKWSEIIYVDASSRESIEGILRAFAINRRIGKTHEDTIRWLESRREPWLLVFDSADDPSFRISDFFPSRNHSSILITTRLPSMVSLARGPKSNCKVTGMKREEALALLLKTARIQDETKSQEVFEEAEELLKDFGYFALAIVHAGAFIQHSPHMTISKYRQEFLARRRRTVESYAKLPPAQRTDEYTKTVYTTWIMCYELLGPQARALLWLIAFLHNDGITEEIFQRAATRALTYEHTISLTELEATAHKVVRHFLDCYLETGRTWDSLLFCETISEIHSRSLLEYDPANGAYNIHVLVQDWLQTVIPYPPELALECTRMLVSLSIDDGESSESVRFRLKLLLHTKTLAAYPDTLGPSSMLAFSEVYNRHGEWRRLEVLQEKLVELLKQTHGISCADTLASMRTLASSYYSQGRQKEAEVLQLQVLDMQKRVLGEEHPETLTSMSNLAAIYWGQGRHNEAELLQIQALDGQKRVLGEEHPYVLRSKNNLASTYLSQGQHNEAEVVMMQVLDVQKRTLAEEHPDTLTNMSNLALAYRGQGLHSKAETLQIQVLNIQKRVLGEEHPHTLRSMNNLALTYWSQGRPNEAEALQVLLLDIQQRVLGEEHPDVLTSMSNLALTYRSQGRHSKAEVLIVQMLGMQKRVLGEEHPDTLTSMTNLASNYSTQDRQNEAEVLTLQVLDIQKRVLGEEHPDTLTSMSNLASTYWSEGRYNEAEVLQVQVLDIQKRVLGEEHPDALRSMNNLASTYSSQGRQNEAEVLMLQVLDMLKRVLGREHPETLTSMSNLASTYWSQGRHAEAEVLMGQVLDIQKRVLGEEHPDTLTSMSGLALNYSSQGRLNEVGMLQAQVLGIQQRVLGEEHPATLRSMNNLALTYSSQDRHNEAETLYVQGLVIRKRVLGEEHPDTLASMCSLAITYSSQGRQDEAEALYIQVLHVQKRTLGEDHPDILVNMCNLSVVYFRQGQISKASELQRQIVNSRRKMLGDLHPSTLEAQDTLDYMLHEAEEV